MFEPTKILFVVSRSAVCDSFASQAATVVTRLNAEVTVFNLDQRPPRQDAADRILDVANAGNADLILMPAQEPGILRRFFGPSTLHKVLRKCRCAVWTASGRQALTRVGFHRIACAVDLAEDSDRVLAAARDLAEQWKCELSIIHAMPEMDESLLQLAALEDLPVTLSPDAVRREVASLQWLAGTSADLHIETSGLASAVRRALRRSRADLLVVGPGRNSERPGVLGPHVKALIGAAPCPVLVLEKRVGSRIVQHCPKRHSIASFRTKSH